MRNAIWIELKNVIGALNSISRVIAEHKGNIEDMEYLGEGKTVHLYLEIGGPGEIDRLINDLKGLDKVVSISTVPEFSRIYGKRVIVIGGGAQVAEVAKGAISEADRHNLRGEKISVDTIPLVGEKQTAEAVRAVARLPRARILILAGSLMGGDITRAVKEIQGRGIPVVSLKMAGSVPKAADLIVSDPIQAGVMAVMAVADTAKFRIEKKGKAY